MRNLLEKVTLFILQNISSLVFILVPVFFLTHTVDYFAFNKFYLLNILASISLLFWCFQNLLNKKINLTFSPALSALFFLTSVSLISAIFMSPTKVLSLAGITTLFFSLWILHLTTTASSASTTIISRQIFALLFSLLLVSVFTILHFFNLTSVFFASDALTSQFFNLTGGIVPALTFSIPLLIGIFAYTYFTENFTTKIILFVISGVVITATIINISLLLPKNGVSPVVLMPLKASWSIALDIFKYPGTALIGTGPDTYLATFTRLRPTFLNDNRNLWNTRFSESGSFLLTILTTTGLIGGLGLFLAYFKNIVLGLKTFNTSDHKPELAFTIVALTIYLIEVIFTPLGIVGIIISITLLGTLTQLLKKENLKSIRPLRFNISSDDNNSTIGYFLPLFTLIASLTLLILYWSFGYGFYKGSILLNQARKNINVDVTGAFLSQVNAQKLSPYDPTYPIVLSQTYQRVAVFYLQKENPSEEDKKNALETMQRTIDYARLAAQLDPFNVVVMENLSNIYQTFIGAANGAGDLALSHIAQAISLDPTNPRLRLQMGILYYNLKDKDQALKLINQSIELKPDWEIPYVNLYKIYAEGQDLQRAESNLKQAIALTSPTSPDYEKLQAELTKLSEQKNKK